MPRNCVYAGRVRVEGQLTEDNRFYCSFQAEGNSNQLRANSTMKRHSMSMQLGLMFMCIFLLFFDSEKRIKSLCNQLSV